MTGNFGNWDGDVTLIGPIYPFVGWELLMVVVLVVLWVGWHVMQIRKESEDYANRTGPLRQGDALNKAVQDEHTIERM